MERRTVGLAEAKTRLSEVTDLAARGEEIVITKRGRAVALLSQVRAPRRRLDLDAARALVRRLPREPEPARELVRRLRDEARY